MCIVRDQESVWERKEIDIERQREKRGIEKEWVRQINEEIEMKRDIEKKGGKKNKRNNFTRSNMGRLDILKAPIKFWVLGASITFLLFVAWKIYRKDEGLN